MYLGENQKLLIILGTLALVVMTFIVPWSVTSYHGGGPNNVSVRYGIIFDPPFDAHLDVPRMIIPMITDLAVMALIVIVTPYWEKPEKKKKVEKNEEAE